MSSANDFNFEQEKIFLFGKEINISLHLTVQEKTKKFFTNFQY